MGDSQHDSYIAGTQRRPLPLSIPRLRQARNRQQDEAGGRWGSQSLDNRSDKMVSREPFGMWDPSFAFDRADLCPGCAAAMRATGPAPNRGGVSQAKTSVRAPAQIAWTAGCLILRSSEIA